MLLNGCPAWHFLKRVQAPRISGQKRDDVRPVLRGFCHGLFIVLYGFFKELDFKELIDIHWWTSINDIHWWKSINEFIDRHPSMNSLMVHQWIWSPFFSSLSLGPIWLTGSGPWTISPDCSTQVPTVRHKSRCWHVPGPMDGYPAMNINGYPSMNSLMVHQWIWSTSFGSLSSGPFLWALSFGPHGAAFWAPWDTASVLPWPMARPWPEMMINTQWIIN